MITADYALFVAVQLIHNNRVAERRNLIFELFFLLCFITPKKIVLSLD